eukprot:TRINITY_DN40949_c0_g1_i1.p1 TRINITY_DN40949_c0_g1~~TRINITY_DN40949_c0_g1_i1.p1  ORF type:complete len:530 (-),score=183.87 TRINITY_DN40949_c0_g1_i1:295-1884(-)
MMSRSSSRGPRTPTNRSQAGSRIAQTPQDRREKLAAKVADSMLTKLTAYARKENRKLPADIRQNVKSEIHGMLNKGNITEKHINALEARYRKQIITDSSRAPSQAGRGATPGNAGSRPASTGLNVTGTSTSRSMGDQPSKDGLITPKATRTTAGADGSPVGGSTGKRRLKVKNADNDEWALIARFYEEEEKERKAKESEEFRGKQKQVRSTLEEQLKEREEAKRKEKEDDLKHAAVTRQLLEQETAQERKKIEKRQQEILREKAIREQQIAESRSIRQQQERRQKAEDERILADIRADLDKQAQRERDAKMQKRLEWKITQEENERQQELKERARQRAQEEDREMQRQYIAMEERKEREREEMLNRKLAKQIHIQATVGKSLQDQMNEKSRQDEDRARKFQEQLEDRQRAEEDRRKERQRQTILETRKELKRQLDEKEAEKQRQREEAAMLQARMRKEAAEEEAARRAAKEAKRQQILNYRKQLEDQIVGLEVHREKESATLSDAERKLNANLLKTIEKKKASPAAKAR